MGDQAPRSRRSEPSETGGRDRDRAGRRGPRRYRIIFAVVGGLLGPGYWLCGAVWDGRPLGKSSAEVHFTEFVLASIVVVVASWGLLLILGEALLFSLAIFRAYDKEQYDIYRNLMILWGYVLTLGIPRHFRKLPAQFGALNDDVRGGSRDDGGRGGHGAPRDGAYRDGARRDGERRSAERPPARDQRRERDTEDARDGQRYRSREDPRDRTGCQNRAQERGGPWDHEDVRDHTPCRKRADTRQRRASSRPAEDDRERDATGSRRREDERSTAGGTEREDAREGQRARRRTPDDDTRVAGRRTRSRDGVRRPPVPPEEPAATLENPLGPIFPPRPAAEAETAPVAPVPPVVPAPPRGAGPSALTVPAVAASLADALATADTIPNASAELRDALGLLLRYAAGLGAVETPSPQPPPVPGGTLGIAAEAAGGDV